MGGGISENQMKVKKTYRIANAKEAVVINDALRHHGLRGSCDSGGHGNGHRLRDGSDRLGVLRVLLNVLRRHRDRSRLLLLNSCLLGASHFDLCEGI
jgi:hypothetical protein